MQKSFAQRMRDVMRIDLKGRDEVSYQDIALRLDLVSNKEKQPIYRSMRDFMKRNEVVRLRPGVFRYDGKKYDPRPATKTHCMYRLIRANRRGTIGVDDLMANCQVEKSTAQEYLRLLVRRGMMRRIPMPKNRPPKYQMIDDPGPNLVKNDENAEKLRRIRGLKTLAREAMDAIQEGLDVAVAAVESIEGELSEEMSDE